MVWISRLNYLNVGPGGIFASSADHPSEPGDVENVATLLRTRKRLVVHLHGGLVPEHAGMDVARNMVPAYEAAGSHPLTVVWETGFLETMRDNVREVATTRLFVKLLKVVLRLILPSLDPITGVKGFPTTPSEAQIDAELARPVPFQAWDVVSQGTAAKAVGTPTKDMLTMHAQLLLQAEPPLDTVADTSPKMNMSRVTGVPQQPGARGPFLWVSAAALVGRVGVRVLSRVLSGRGHGLYPTTVEELLRELLLADFGAAVWGAMKEKAALMFSDGGAVPRAGAYLVDRLAALQEELPGLVVDVVGHSAGSIAAAHLMARAERRGLRVRKVAFLAPAIRVDAFAKEVLPRYGPKATFGQFRSFTMDDDFEVRDHLVGPLYTRSLLYLISGLLEDDDGDTPLAGLERHVEGRAPYVGGAFAATHGFLYEPGEHRLVLSKTSASVPRAPADMRSESEHHGDFDDDVTTRAALSAYLK